MAGRGLAARAQHALELAASQQSGSAARSVVDALREVYADSGDEPLERARLAAALGRALVRAKDLTSAAPYADEAVLLAEDLDDPLLLADALDARLTTRSGPDDLEIRLATSLRLLGLVRHVAEPDVRLGAHLWRLTTGLEALDLSVVRRQLAALDLLADETGDERVRFYACARRAMFALTEGDLVGAQRLAADAGEAGRTGGVPETDDVLRSLGVELARQRGDRAALGHEAAATAELADSLSRARAAVLWLESGEPEEAGHLVDRLAPTLTTLPRDAAWLLVVAQVCEAAVGTRRTAVASGCADRLAPYAGRAVLHPGGAVFSGVVEDYLAQATGDPERSAQARAAYERIGADWWSRRGQRRRPAAPRPAPIGPRVLHLHPRGTQASRLWCVGREGEVRMVPSMRGLEYLRLLLERPGTDVPASELAAAADPGVTETGTGPLVDQRALAEHRQRQRRRAEELGTGQRPEEPVERTRAGVLRAVGAALARLELYDVEVAHELRSTIRVGATCRYEPAAGSMVEWRLSDTHRTSAPSSR